MNTSTGFKLVGLTCVTAATSFFGPTPRAEVQSRRTPVAVETPKTTTIRAGTTRGTGEFSVPEFSPVLSRVAERLPELQSDVVLTQVQQVLARLNNRLLGERGGVLPQMVAAIREDGSMVIEWMRPNCRFSISIDRDSSDSSWAFVSKVGDQACGPTSGQFECGVDMFISAA